MRRITTIAITALALAWPVSAWSADEADNSKRNVQDRQEQSVTPGDQGDSEADVNTTKEIRRQVVANDSFSTNAKNVKIITREGVVTLRGPVKSADEKAAIVAIATKAPGVTKVDDQLEVEGERGSEPVKNDADAGAND
jgi:hyperosmotically inducible protein